MKINDFIKEGHVIDLSGPQGNAYALLGIAKRLAKQLNLDYNKIQKEMTSSDYTNLVDIFKQYFGNYVDIEEDGYEGQAEPHKHTFTTKWNGNPAELEKVLRKAGIKAAVKKTDSGFDVHTYSSSKEVIAKALGLNEKQEMCPEACCGIPVTECHCPADCPHCKCNAPGGPGPKAEKIDEDDFESKYSRYVTLLFHRQDEKFQETVLNQLRKEHGPGNFSEVGIKAVQEPTGPGYPGKQKEEGVGDGDVPKDHEYGPSSRKRPTGKQGYTSSDNARTAHLKTVKKYGKKKRRQIDKTATTETNPAPGMNIYNLYTTKSKDGDFQAWQGNKHLGSFKTIEDLDKFLILALNSGKLQPQT